MIQSMFFHHSIFMILSTEKPHLSSPCLSFVAPFLSFSFLRDTSMLLIVDILVGHSTIPSTFFVQGEDEPQLIEAKRHFYILAKRRKVIKGTFIPHKNNLAECWKTLQITLIFLYSNFCITVIKCTPVCFMSYYYSFLPVFGLSPGQ